MAKKDYYEILGISKNASQEEIKKAFKQLARKWHPDVHPTNKKEAEEKFKEANEAFQVLNDTNKRAQYDQYGQTDFNGNQGFNGFNSQGFGFEDIFRNFGFEDLFGGSNRREREENFDIRYDADITLEEAFNGVNKNIEVPQFTKCDYCKGTGAEKGNLEECKNCDGHGQVKKVHRTVFEQIVNVTTCHKCGGAGKIITKPCEKCHGEGRIKKNKKIEVNIPKGVDSEQYIRVPLDYGSLFVVINVLRHDIFDRNEDDLYCVTEVDLWTAIKGGEVEVPTINGKAKLMIPLGTQSHTVFRLKGQGLHRLNSGKRGDQLVKVVVDIPSKLNKKQEEVLKELFKDKKVETKKGFFEKVKEFV